MCCSGLTAPFLRQVHTKDKQESSTTHGFLKSPEEGIGPKQLPGLGSGDLVVTSKTSASPPQVRLTASTTPNDAPFSFRDKPGRLGALVLRMGVGTLT